MCAIREMNRPSSENGRKVQGDMPGYPLAYRFVDEFVYTPPMRRKAKLSLRLSLGTLVIHIGVDARNFLPCSIHVDQTNERICRP